MYEKITLKKYLDMIADSSPTPGGGSVSAFAGALASSLGVMTCGIALRKAKKSGGDMEMVKRAKKVFQKNYQHLLKLAELDSQAYDMVSEAYKIPHYELNRRKKINLALKHAAEIPYQVMWVCQNNLREMFNIRNILPSQILSDISVAVLLTKAAYNGARLNVIINMESIKDKALICKLQKDIEKLEKTLGEVLIGIDDWL